MRRLFANDPPPIALRHPVATYTLVSCLLAVGAELAGWFAFHVRGQAEQELVGGGYGASLLRVLAIALIGLAVTVPISAAFETALLARVLLGARRPLALTLAGTASLFCALSLAAVTIGGAPRLLAGAVAATLTTVVSALLAHLVQSNRHAASVDEDHSQL